METFLMRVEGEGQNLLGGVAMARCRRRYRRLGAAASISRRRDVHFDFGARRSRRLGGPVEDPALSAPTPTLHASPSRDLAPRVVPPGGRGPRERRAGGGACEENPERAGRLTLRAEQRAGEGGACGAGGGRALRDELI